MKKLNLFIITVFAMLLTVTTAHAADVDAWSSRNWESVVSTSADGVVTIKLTKDSDAGLEVKNNKKVILDLNGNTLKNWCDGQQAHCGFNNYAVTIEIDNGCELTITDTSAAHNGKVILASDTKNVSTVVNNGKLTIEYGEYSVTTDVGNGLSTIYNNGEMLVKGGTFKSQVEGAAAIHNQGILNINGGDFSTEVAKSWAVSNNGTATIKGGTFTQNYDYSVLVNTKKMTIEDGDFKTAGSTEHNSLITNQKSGANKAELTIRGGDFNAKLLFYNQGEDELNVIGGNYSEDSNIATYLDSNHQLDKNGNVILKDANYSALKKALKEAKEVDKTKYTEESVKALENAIKNAEAIRTNLKITEQAKIDEAVKELQEAIKGLTVKETPVAPESSKPITDAENPDTADNFFNLITIATISIVGLFIICKKYILD